MNCQLSGDNSPLLLMDVIVAVVVNGALAYSRNDCYALWNAIK